MQTHTQLLKRFIAILLFSTLVLGCPNSPATGSFDDARKAYKAGDYKKALEIFKPLVEQGDSKAQFILGVMHGRGQGVPQDYAEAVKWHQKSAEKIFA